MLTPEQKIDRVEAAMTAAREQATKMGRVCNFRTLARAAHEEENKIRAQEARDAA